MNITKCDLCKKTIKSYTEIIHVRNYSSFGMLEFCIECALPIVKFLNKNELLDEKAKITLATAV